jgi:uncharacterized cupredoxin-like copper-binding protein
VAAVVTVVVVAGVTAGARAAMPGARATDSLPETRVTVSNFKIDAPAVLPGGRVRLLVRNSGPSMHELNVVRTGRSAKGLPLTAAGIVDDQVPHTDFDHLAEAEGIEMGQQKSMTVTLSPGTYVLYCNMDGHYLGGMSATFRVLP